MQGKKISDYPVLDRLIEVLNNQGPYPILQKHLPYKELDLIESIMQVDFDTLLDLVKQSLVRLVEDNQSIISKLRKERDFRAVVTKQWVHDYNLNVTESLNHYCDFIEYHLKRHPCFPEKDIVHLNLKVFFKKWLAEFATNKICSTGEGLENIIRDGDISPVEILLSDWKVFDENRHLQPGWKYKVVGIFEALKNNGTIDRNTVTDVRIKAAFCKYLGITKIPKLEISTKSSSLTSSLISILNRKSRPAK